MTATTTRNRSLTLTAGALAAVAGLAFAGHASAAPTAPTITPAPEFVQPSLITPTWSASIFDPRSRNQGYEALLVDMSAPGIRIANTTARTTSLPVLNGHQYRLTVRGLNNRCIAFTPLGGCTFYLPTPTYSPESAPVTIKVDGTAPTAAVVVNGGAQFTRTREVQVAVTGTDPASGPGPASGVATVQIGNEAGLPCTIASPTEASCPQPLGPSRSHLLADGPDGERTVHARTRDNAVAGWSDRPQLLGNPSDVVTDTIILDRTPPVAVVNPQTAQVLRGVPVQFSAAGSTDATSGVDPAATVWQFGDGTSASGLQVSKAYSQPGTYNGTVTVRDRADNASQAQFTVTVQPGVVIQNVRITSLTRLNRAVAFRQVRVRANLSRPSRVTATLRRNGVVVRTIRVNAASARPLIRFQAPRAGRYTLRVVAGNSVRSLPIQVTRR